jgi:hypothetical protein
MTLDRAGNTRVDVGVEKPSPEVLALTLTSTPDRLANTT